MIYIGKHRGTTDDGYISSGGYFLAHYNHNPASFYREIVHRGGDRECLIVESQMIKAAIQQLGFHMLYNRTHWHFLKQNSVRCLWCDSVCDPSNVAWYHLFETQHFQHCPRKPQPDQPDAQYILSTVGDTVTGKIAHFGLLEECRCGDCERVE
jgi:hypothetical protein